MIRFVFRWAFRLALLALVLVIGLLLLKDTLIKNLAERTLRQRSGLQVNIGRMEMGLLNPTVSIQNLVIYNSADFGGSVLMDIPDLRVEYSFDRAASGRLRMKLLRVNLKELAIVENERGETNIVNFFDKVATGSLDRKKKNGSGGSDLPEIEMLNLSVGRVRYTNMRHPRFDQDIRVNVENELTRNVRTKEDFITILLRLLVRSGITIYLDTPQAAAHHAKPAL